LRTGDCASARTAGLLEAETHCARAQRLARRSAPTVNTREERNAKIILPRVA
jgi:hypothetical protein